MANKGHIEFSKFKKGKSDKNTTELHHPDGHIIKIVHSALSPKMRSQLAELPHYAEGTPEGPIDVATSPNQAASTFTPQNTPPDTSEASNPISAINPRINPGSDLPYGVEPEKYAEMINSQQDQVKTPVAKEAPKAEPKDNAPVAAEDPYGQNAYLNEYQKGLQEQEAGLYGKASAEAKLGKEQSEAMEPIIMGSPEQFANMNDVSNAYVARNQALTKEYNDFINDYKAQHIDENHVVDNMSTTQKVLTTLNLAIGGAFGALTPGGHNGALDMLNGYIARDVDSQLQNANIKKNLLSANAQQFGNQRDAAQMSMSMLQGLAAAKAQQLSMQAQGPLAKANALQLAGQLHQQAAQTISQIAMRRTMYSALSNGTSNPNTMQQALNAARMLDPKAAADMESRYLPGVGMAQVPIPNEVKANILEKQNFDRKIKELEQFSKMHSGTLPTTPTNIAIINQGKALAAQVQDAYRQGNHQGVFKPAERDFVTKSVVDDPTKFFSNLRALPGYAVSRRNNTSDLNNLYKSYGLPTPQPVSESPIQRPASKK